MHEDRDLLAAVVDRRRRPSRARLGELDRAARVVDEAARLGKAVADDERRIAQRARELAAQRARLVRGAEVDDQARDDGLRPAAAQQVDEQHERDGRR